MTPSFLSRLTALALLALGSACPTAPCEPQGEPVLHQGTISASETWASGIHLLSGTVTVGSGATLTLSGCSVLRLAPDASLVVSSAAGGLVAPGTLDAPIRLERADPGSPWGSLVVVAPATGTLSHVVLEGGGGSDTNLTQAEFAGASLAARGTADTLPVVLSLENVGVLDSTGIGVFMLNARFAEGSEGLVISGAGWFPLYTGANALSALPEGSYTGNEVDEILLQTIGPAGYQTTHPLAADVTIHDRGVPYRVGTATANIVVGDGTAEGPPALLTIAAGVTLKFAPAGQLRVTGRYNNGSYLAQGALRVEGTSAAPVRFTSAAATPQAGDWAGIYFHHVVDPRTSITSAQVEYAGGESNTSGVCKASPGASNYDADCSLILFLEEGQTPAPFVTQTRFAHGLGCGVYRGWRGTEVDFTATNEFVNLQGCRQSGVVPEMGTCPDCSL